MAKKYTEKIVTMENQDMMTKAIMEIAMITRVTMSMKKIFAMPEVE